MREYTTTMGGFFFTSFKHTYTATTSEHTLPTTF